MEKISIRFKNGYLFHVLASVIAVHRTTYYGEKYGFGPESPEWEEEYKNSLEEHELMDWVQNNMDWSDLEGYAIRVHEGRAFNFNIGFYDAEINYIPDAKNG